MEQAAPNKIPIMTISDLTPENLCAFKMACRAYFQHREVPEDEQVKKVAWGIQDPQVQNWYIANQFQIDMMDFDTYMGKL